MFKVLIVDDEPIIRKGLKNILNWKQFECEVCGEAANGLEGCDMARSILPEIIITDIRMPEIDGLAMIREIKQSVPWCKIIILTGYRDFDYVQEALKLGAFDFILKPSKIEELTSVISKAVKELKFYRDRDEEVHKLKELFLQNVPILREKLMYDIIFGINTNESEIMAKMQLFEITIDEFILLILENDVDENLNAGGSQYDMHLYQFGIINAFEESFSNDFKVISVTLNNNRVAFVVQPVVMSRDITRTVNEKCTNLQDIIKNCFGFSLSIAVSSPGKGPLDLPQKLKEAQDALEYKLYMGSGCIINFCDLESFFKCEDYSLLEKYQSALLESIKTGNEQLVSDKLKSIFKYLSSLNHFNKQYLKSFFFNTISVINNIRISINAVDDERQSDKSNKMDSLYKLLEKCNDLNEFNVVLEEAALKVASKVNSFNNKSIRLVLRRAMDYICAHYNEQITLNEVAENIYVSTYYISRMFKKELGKNFVDYLNEIRIEKAKELLKDVRYKTYEVAEMVGIPDAHYFSKLFKKYAGLTPTEYRDSSDADA